MNKLLSISMKMTRKIKFLNTDFLYLINDNILLNLLYILSYIFKNIIIFNSIWVYASNCLKCQLFRVLYLFE